MCQSWALVLLFDVHSLQTPDLIDNVVHGCAYVKAVIDGATFSGGHFVGRVCAQCSFHSLMRVGVGIGYGRCRGGSGGIIFMEANPQSCMCIVVVQLGMCIVHVSHIVVVFLAQFSHVVVVVAVL